MRRIARRATQVVAVLALVVAVGAATIRFVPMSQVSLIALASVAPIVFVAFLVVATAGLIAFGGRARTVAGAVVVMVAAAGAWPLVPRFVADDPPTESLTVLTANIELGQGSVDELAELVRDKHVDVLAVQELTDDAARAVAASSIARELPHAIAAPANLAYGSALYSRYPLSEAAQLPGLALASLTGVVEVPAVGDVKVFAVHPVPPTFPGDWAEELERIGSFLDATSDSRPVIALGDFNSTVDHVQFRRLLSGGFRDAAEVAGAGLLRTYPADKWYPPVVGIDHVVVRDLGASEVTSHRVTGADHRAVLAVLG